MRVIEARNVNGAFWQGLTTVRLHGHLRSGTRTGAVLECPWPVATVVQRPAERVLWHAGRNANPFFHLMEAAWMLCGRNDVESLAQYNEKMRDFSDDGITFHGAYGARWRRAGATTRSGGSYVRDQLNELVALLRCHADTRRAVLQVWDFRRDLGAGHSRDLPCNTLAFFLMRDGALCMTVLCRSNDAIWGAYGANAVHWSVLQEYIAARVGVPLGTMTQVSNSLHVYPDVAARMGGLDELSMKISDPYEWAGDREGQARPMPMMEAGGWAPVWDSALQHWFGLPTDDNLNTQWARAVIGRNRWLDSVLHPMRMAWMNHKRRDYSAALEWASTVEATDWNLAAKQWLERTRARWEAKQRSEHQARLLRGE